MVENLKSLIDNSVDRMRFAGRAKASQSRYVGGLGDLDDGVAADILCCGEEALDDRLDCRKHGAELVV